MVKTFFQAVVVHSSLLTNFCLLQTVAYLDIQPSPFTAVAFSPPNESTHCDNYNPFQNEF